MNTKSNLFRAAALLLLALGLKPLAFSQHVPFAFWESGAVLGTNPVSGYAFWWNPDAGVTQSGSAVTTWTDRSASALVLTAGGAGPSTSTVNGHVVLEFSDAGLGNYLANTAQTLSSPWELVAVVKTGSDVLNGNPFCIEADAGTARGVLVSSSDWELSWNGTSFGAQPAAATWYVVDCVFLATGESTLSTNGTAAVTQSGAFNTVTGIEVGGFGTTYPWSGAIGDIIIYTPPLNSTQQARNLTTLRNKYGF
jgi:hypothetical protein